MSEGLNRVILLGNLGSDPELRVTPGGTAVLTLSLATNESFLDKNKERQERTEWHQVVVFGARAEGLSRVLKKGMGVLIEGGLRTSSYESGGVKRSRTEIVAREICFTGGPRPEPVSEEGDELRLAVAMPAETAPPPSKRNGKREPAKQTSIDEIPF